MPTISADRATRLLESFYLAAPMTPPSNFGSMIRMGLLGTNITSDRAGYSPVMDGQLDGIRDYRRTRTALAALSTAQLATLAAYHEERQRGPEVAKALGSLAGVACLILATRTVVDEPRPMSQRCPGAELARLVLIASQKTGKQAKSELASLRTLAKDSTAEAMEAFARAYESLLAQEREAKRLRVSRSMEASI